MSSIMRARNALTGRGEEAEVIGGVLFELKGAGPSMLGIGCPDRHPLPLIHSPPLPKMHPPRRRPPARAGSFSAPFLPFAIAVGIGSVGWICDLPDLPGRSLKADLRALAARIAASRRVWLTLRHPSPGADPTGTARGAQC